MNFTQIANVTEAADRLHFEKALQDLEECRRENEEDPRWNRLMARVLRGLFFSHRALKHARKAGSDWQGRLELAKCLFACGEISEAGSRLHELAAEDPQPEVLTALAAWCGETGRVRQGRRILKELGTLNLKPGMLRMDQLILNADLASFEEETEEAFRYYHQALQETADCIPKNWQPLRRMLILHNMADTLEQLEQPDQALEVYRQALQEMSLQKRKDSHITDLSGYEMELLLSVANCFGNAQDFDQAAEYLGKAGKLMTALPPRQMEYFQARTWYISGLLALNEGRNTQAADCFEKALKLQEKLCLAGRDKPEHPARSAYYLASVLPDDQADRKLSLYEKAWPVFEQMQEKEPSFYLLGLADMENEKGRLSHDFKEAADHYRRALEFYQLILARQPDDQLARESQLATMANLYHLKSDASLARQIREGLISLRRKDPNWLFLQTITDFLLQSPESAQDFRKWLASFANTLENHCSA